jgi:LuxR family maltose regulon positive regulatory protein
MLRTKLYIPTPRADLVKRERLYQRLGQGLRGKLTLVSAPAGFGKTTLIADWVNEADLHPGWVSLDERDNDPVSFLSYIVEAIKSDESSLGESILSEIQSPQSPSIEAILTAWINEISNYASQLILVLDDYHAIGNQSVHQILEFLLEYIPPNFHLVLICRSDPNIAFGRLRGSGQLVEIREVDLRFTESEVYELFDRIMGLPLSEQNVSALEHRTEGWAVGLRLAGLALQGREDVDEFINAFTGGHQFILDYLTEEVFERQPEEVQDFLMRTCVLERMCAPLCNAVTGMEDGEATLLLLNQLNLFIIPLDEFQQWYRYHHLFAELLRYKLDQLPAKQVVEIHERASSWYAENDLIPEAVSHAMTVENFSRAADLIEPVTSPMIGRGEIKTVQVWIEALPESLVKERPRLSITMAWIFNLNNTGDDIEPLLQNAERALDAGNYDQATVAELRGHSATLRGYTALQQNNPPLALQHMAEAMAWLPEEDVYLRSIVSFTQGVIYKRGGVWEPAEETLKLAESYGRASGNYSIAIGSRAHLVEMLIIQGKLKQAAKYCNDAIEYYLSIFKGNPIPNLGFIYTKLGEILYEWNDLESASEHLTRGLEMSSKIIAAWAWERDALICLTRLRKVEGDPEEAQRLLEQAFDVSEHMQDLYDKMDLSFEQARLWLSKGDLTGALRWAREYQNFSEGQNEQADVMLARVLLAHGEADRAREILGSIGEAAEASGRTSRWIEVLILQALLYAADKDFTMAFEVLARTLNLGEPEGFIRVFADEGANLLGLLRKMDAGSTDHMGEAYLFSNEYLSRIIAATLSEKPAVLPDKSTLLNKREKQILRLMSAGLKTPEIAEELYLSKNTIKWYVRKIYEKLDVHSKAEAIEQGYRLGLLR